MTHSRPASALAAVSLLVVLQPLLGASEKYTKIAPVMPKVIAAAESFPGGSFRPENILRPMSPRGNRAEYASRGMGEKTFIDFDFGKAVPVRAFQHVQRKASDTVAESALIFSDDPQFKNVVTRVTVEHVDEPGAVSFAEFPLVSARYVRWQVTRVSPNRSQNIGGQFLQFFTADGPPDAEPSGVTVDVKQVPIVERSEGRLQLPLHVTVHSPYAESLSATVTVGGRKLRELTLTYGENSLLATHAAPTDAKQTVAVSLEIDDRPRVTKEVEIDPKRVLTVYVLPHSHTDIGYTAIQTDIEEKQINNLLQGLAEAQRTADYPEGARFIWNVEVTWAVDLFLERMPEQQRKAFTAAVKSGQLALNGMYLNELTGLCRPEELIRLFRYATKLADEAGVSIESAMISDVPGYTWGTVPAMNAAGIRYFSVAPNYFDRIGDILLELENKPFWWVGPDGRSRVLVWIPYRGYALSHIYRKLSKELVHEFCDGLRKQQYPYDIAYIRWSGYGDNAAPDASICDFIRDWNATHVSPHFVISSTDTAFRAFDQRYGAKIPELRGDWTPYWEDGAGSSAFETALNRASSERLAQAQALWAMAAPRSFPAAKFAEAWQQTLLYSEHTWGAHCSISQPTIPFTVDQWNIKQSYALTANLQSRQLLSAAAQTASTKRTADLSAAGDHAEFVDVYNTNSWTRTELVYVPRELSRAGDAVQDDQGNPVPSQRLASDELAIRVENLAPFSGRRYRVASGPPTPGAGAVRAEGTTLDSGRLSVRLNETDGGIVELHAQGIDANLVDASSGHALNDYLYLLGDDPAEAQKCGPVSIKVRDKGPLVASLLVTSEAPGCWQLQREVRVVANDDYVELVNTVDKRRLDVENYFADEGKESVNFAFPLNVPDGSVRLDVPLAVMQPEKDQIPSACKNWFTVGRWADVSNRSYGATWVTADAPLVQVGGLTATLLNSQSDPGVWRKVVEPTQKLYSWAMNNHWGTNYRAFQEGPVQFRYAVRPHVGPHDDVESTRFATAFTQPLLALPGRGPAPPEEPLITLDPSSVIVVGLKPSDDGQAIIARMLNVSDQPQQLQATWASSIKRVYQSNTAETPGEIATEKIDMGPRELVTVRAEFECAE